MAGFNIFGWDVKTNYTEKLSEYIHNLSYSDIPAEVIERAKLCTLHSIGCSLAATPMRLTEVAQRIGEEISGDGPATAWTTGKKMSPAAACFANGAACDMLDWEDCTYTGHPSYALVPAAFAVAEQLNSTGKEYLTAYIAGFEVYQRVALCVGDPGKIPHVRFGHALPNWPIFGATAATAKLYGLNSVKCNQALGMASIFHKVTSSGVQATLSEAYHLEAGFVAQSGLEATMCAREGINNLLDTFDIPYMFNEQFLEEPMVEWLDKELGSRYMLMEMLIKHWPANMWLQNPIEAAINLLNEHQFSTDEIEEIIVNPPMEYRMHHRPEGYDSIMDAEFSTPYVLAVALLNPVPSWKWFSEENMKDSKVLALAAKVKPGNSESLTLLGAFDVFTTSKATDFPERTVTITLKNGESYSESVTFPKGHPMNMLTRDEFHELFLHQCSYSIDADKAEGLFQFIVNLEDQDDFSEISKFFQK